jgi:type IV pilus biogenesis protein CpaD/CtpE
MKNDLLQKGILFLGVFATALTLGLVGCASTPPERTDHEKIKQDADKGMQDLQREEDRHGDTDGY